MASKCSNRDKVIALVESREDNGYTYRGSGDLMISTRVSFITPVHEFGHNFGRLYDERSGNINKSLEQGLNCVDTNNPCPWTAGVGCYLGCGNSVRDWYRPTNNTAPNCCIMVGNLCETPQGHERWDYFDPVCKNKTINLLNNYN